MRNTSQDSKTKEFFQAASKSIWFKKISALLNYKKVQGYIDPKDLSKLLATYLWTAETFPTRFLHSDPITVKATCAAHEIVNSSSLTCYWLGLDLLKALRLTELPNHWVDLKPFVNSAVLFLPELIRNPDGFTVQWLYFSYYPVGYIFPDLKIGQVPIQSLDEALEYPVIRWVTGFKDLSCYTSTIVLKPDSQGNPIHGEFYIDPTIEFFNGNTEILSEQEFGQTLDNLVFQILLYLMEKPDAITIERSRIGFAGASKKNKGKKLDATPIAAKWIGFNYQFKRQISDNSDLERNSPRTHWRRGHWRKQPFGSRENPEYKTIWIEPMIISG